MPEGPELHLSSRFVNRVCQGRIFGRILKSEVSKNPVVSVDFEKFTICASSRGKELKLTLTENTEDECKIKPRNVKVCPETVDILLNFGMSGRFDFHEATDLQKHAHLNFFTSDDGSNMVLSFIDYRRFGKWLPGRSFSLDERGPCVLQESQQFREHVLDNLDNNVFNKPICEVLLNQKYFNGIGNYLRAEILYRAKIAPFVCARSVLEPLTKAACPVKSEEPDILQLCSILPNEVIQLEGSWYDGQDRDRDSNKFNTWLQCYYQDGMSAAVDHNKRTIWYSGPLGPMAPKDVKTRGRKVGKKKTPVKPMETQSDTVKVEKEQRTSRKRRHNLPSYTDQRSDGVIGARKFKPEEDQLEIIQSNRRGEKCADGTKSDTRKRKSRNINNVDGSRSGKVATETREISVTASVGSKRVKLLETVSERLTRAKLKELVNAPKHSYSTAL